MFHVYWELGDLLLMSCRRLYIWYSYISCVAYNVHSNGQEEADDLEGHVSTFRVVTRPEAPADFPLDYDFPTLA